MRKVPWPLRKRKSTLSARSPSYLATRRMRLLPPSKPWWSGLAKSSSTLNALRNSTKNAPTFLRAAEVRVMPLLSRHAADIIHRMFCSYASIIRRAEDSCLYVQRVSRMLHNVSLIHTYLAMPPYVVYNVSLMHRHCWYVRSDAEWQPPLKQRRAPASARAVTAPPWQHVSE